MPLSIRNPRAESLAREVAARCGENITQAIISSLEERLQRIAHAQKSPDREKDMRIIAERCQTLPDIDLRSADEILGYDERGI